MLAFPGRHPDDIALAHDGVQDSRSADPLGELGIQRRLITISGGGHGMGGWDKLKSDDKEQLVAWFKTTLK